MPSRRDLTLESVGRGAEFPAAQGSEVVSFTQREASTSQRVSWGQQWTWSSQHTACTKGSIVANRCRRLTAKAGVMILSRRGDG